MGLTQSTTALKLPIMKSDNKIAILTDLHFESTNEEQLFDILDDTLERIQSHSPDKLVILGDIVQHTNPSTDRRLIEDCIDRFIDAELSFRCLPGNHDVNQIGLDAYTKLVGNQPYGAEGNKIFLDSSAEHLSNGRGEIPDEQLAFLEDALASMTTPLVFVHHPIHYHNVRENRWFASSPETAFCGNKETVIDRLDSSQAEIRSVINSHLHEWNYTTYRGIDHFTIDSFNKLYDPNAETGSFALVELNDHFRITQYNADGSEQSILLA